MGLNPQVALPRDFIDKSMQWAQQVVDDYASGRNAKSRAVTCFDAHANVDLQAKARMAECAFALWCGCDPFYALRWERTCDDGSDLFWRGKRWDVKATKLSGRYLIWPIAKNHIYDSKRFDMLVLVKHQCPQFEIAGFVSKAEFRERKKVAPADHALFVGTWHLHESDLWPVELLGVEEQGAA